MLIALLMKSIPVFVMLFPLMLIATSPEESTRFVSWVRFAAAVPDTARGSDRRVVFQKRVSSIAS